MSKTIFIQDAKDIICARQDARLQSRQFMEFFGIDSVTCERVWSVLHSNRPLQIMPKHLLFSLLFLRTYSTEGILSTLTDMSAKTFRGHVWNVITRLANLGQVR